ncbi:MAG: DNA translocase FtsK [Bacteroidaceae bacterium]|nr:DNA translocase FtsK [Bacteroidaceae bacterium]
MAKNNQNTSTKKKGKKSGSDIDIMSKMAITKFIVGITLVFVALFLLIAFSSFLYSGASDYSLVDTQNFNEFYSELVAQNKGAKNICGAFGALTAFTFINKLFGVASYFIPVFLVLLGMKLIGSFRIRIVRIFILMGIVMIWLSLLLSALTIDIPALGDTFYYLGGYSGMQIVKWLRLMIGSPGVYGALALIAIFVLLYLSSRTIDVIRSMTRLERIKSFGNPFKSLLHKNEDDEEEMDVEPDPDDFENPTTHVIDLTDHEPKEEVESGNSAIVTPTGTVDSPKDDHSTGLTSEPVTSSKPDTPETGDVEFGVTVGTTTPTTTQQPDLKRGDINTPYDPKLSLEHYKYPTLSLLDKGEDSTPAIDMDEQKANKDRIIQVLHSFGVEISSIKATIGPTITLYEITPAEGMRISKIRNLEDDIALSLAAEGIRIIAPIPGKGTIGIEVPNKKKCVVSMESILNSKTYQDTKMELPCALGKTITNEVFMIDLAKAPHMLVAGATGMGKSVGLNAIVTSLLYKKHPSELKIVMVDPKKVEFSVYNPIENHFLAKLEEEEEPIITDVQKVVKTLNSLCKLMDTRYDLLKAAGVRNIKEYNEAFKARKLNPMQGHDFMPYYVVIIDEFGDLIMTAGKEIELPICRIAQLARAVGIHMIIATQRPTAQIITGTIKANFPARVAFRVAAMMDSRIILDRPGANQLIGRGDMLYLNGGDPTRVQCAFVDTPEVSRICKFISSQQSFGHAAYLPEVDSDDVDGGDSGEIAGRLDPMFEECAKLVVSSQQGSTSMLQRNFSIGYNRAGKIMDQLQKAGVVGPQVGAKPRDVLVQDFNTLDTIIKNLR